MHGGGDRDTPQTNRTEQGTNSKNRKTGWHALSGRNQMRSETALLYVTRYTSSYSFRLSSPPSVAAMAAQASIDAAENVCKGEAGELRACSCALLAGVDCSRNECGDFISVITSRTHVRPKLSRRPLPLELSNHGAFLLKAFDVMAAALLLCRAREARGSSNQQRGGSSQQASCCATRTSKSLPLRETWRTPAAARTTKIEIEGK